MADREDGSLLDDLLGAVRKLGAIGSSQADEFLRASIAAAVSGHYRAAHGGEKFVPGETPVPYGGRVFDEKEIQAAVEAALDFWLTEGRFARDFARGLERFLGAGHCRLTVSGSAANLLAVAALTSPELGERRLRPGDEVLTTACAFPTTVAPIVQHRLVPVFVDVDPATGNVRPELLAPALGPRVKAIVLAHSLGNPFALDRVLELAKEHNLWVIEDCCDALGSRYRGRPVGTFGDLATFSFYPAHQITTGEGGAVVAADEALDKLVASFRDWGRDCHCPPGKDNTCGRRFDGQFGDLPAGYDHKYVYSHLGYNLKMTEMQAAIGVAQLDKLPRFIRQRQKNWQRLADGLRDNPHFLTAQPAPESEPCWFGFPLLVKPGAPFTRAEIVSHLEGKKIATRPLFAGNIVRHPAFTGVEHRVAGTLENTDLVLERTFWIGVYPGLTGEMVEFLVKTLNEFTAGREGTA